MNGTTAEPSTLDDRGAQPARDARRRGGRWARSRRRGDRLAIAGGKPRADRARVDGRARMRFDRHALLHPAAATRDPRRVLPGARGGHTTCRGWSTLPSRTAVGVTLDTLKAVQGALAALRRHEAGRQRSRLRVRMPARVRPRLQSLRRSRGAQLPDDDHWRLRPHERRRQPEAEGAAEMCEAVFNGDLATGSDCTSSCSRSTRPCSSTRTRSR